MKTAAHIECIADPYFKDGTKWDDGTPTAGTAVAASGVLTLTGFQGTCTATMGYDIDALGAGIKELYHWELWVDTLTLGGGTLTVSAGGETIKSITATGKFSGTIEPDNDATGLTIVAATANVAATMSRCSLVKHGHGMNAR